jgi:hypothetical protein
MKQILITGFILLAVPAISGCSSDDLPKYEKLEKLRVLALIASAPEVDPGTTVTITPVVSDINGGGRALTADVEACLDPGIGYGVAPTCSGALTRVVLQTNQSVTGLASPEYTGSVSSTFTVTVPPSVLIFAGRTAAEQQNGVPYLVTYTLKAASGEQLRTFRRILVSLTTKTAKNQNPVLSDILFNDVSATSYPGLAVKLTPTFGAGSQESYHIRQGDGSDIAQTEELTVTWLSTDGTLLRSRTIDLGENTFTPPGTKPSSHAVVLLGVVRDDRGGVGIKQLNL